MDNVVSITEHASSFGPFSVVVWWFREFGESDAIVVRAGNENQSA